MAWVVGVDVGGTFTDFCLWNEATGLALVHKIPSTPDDPSRAIIAGLAALKEREGIDCAAIGRFAHGTTVATNTLIERSGGRAAMITTAGFKDLIEIGRQTRPRIYDLKADAPAPLVPRELRIEVKERVGPRGEVICPLTEAEIDRAVDLVAAADIDCCAVCLLFAFLNPEHERRIGAALHKRRPDLSISLSSDVQPEFREYERFSTTVLNAYLKPKVSHYLERLCAALHREAPTASIGISQSSGGLMNLDRASELPIRTALSGPAAGVVGAVAVARRSGSQNLITLDMGGTSTDVCLIENGSAMISYGRDIAGFPVRLPSIDIHTVGAGGGSIAHIGLDGLMKVGPTSAGAQPGPACYGRGGTLPTVSDANVVLGRLPDTLAGGGIQLDRGAAEQAINPLAERLGLPLHETAFGILRIATSNVVRAIRAVSVERGYDPRRFVLMPFGGAGGLHAVDVARELGMREILVPAFPGILCAEGVSLSEFEDNFVATCRTELDDDLSMVRGALQRLVAQARTWRTHAARNAEGFRLTATVDMRYVGQNYELAIPISNDGVLVLPKREHLRAAFFAEHQAKYGHHDSAARIEIVNVRLRANAGSQSDSPLRVRVATNERPRTTRPVWFESTEPEETTLVDRSELGPSAVVAGPAIITQLDSTTVVPPGAQARVDNALNIIIRSVTS